jgi:hypothetical protein
MLTTTHWYVYKRGGGTPFYRHLSYESAVLEAKRLVDAVGGEFEILEAKALVKEAPKYVVEEFRNSVQLMDEPPF